MVFFRWSVEEGWPILDCSANVVSLLGREAGDLVASRARFIDFIHPEDRAETKSAAGAYLAGGDADFTQFPYRIVRSDGTIRNVIEQTRLEDDGNGNVSTFVGYVLDISGWRAQEREFEETVHELRRARALLEDTSRMARIGAWELDIQSGRLHWTDTTRDIHEVDTTFDPSLDTAIAFYREGESREKIRDAVDRALATGESYDLELEIVRASGKPLWVRTTGHVATKDGVPERMFGVFQDIDQRKRAEITLRESEARWQFALEGAGDGIWEWNAHTGETFFSRRWKMMLGYEQHEIANRFEEWIRLLHPEDRDQTLHTWRLFLTGEQDTMNTVYRLRCSDSSYRWILSRGMVMERDPQGSAARIVGTHADITEQKLGEEARYRRLVRQLREVVFRTDGKGRWTFLNPAWETITGETVRRCLGRRLLDFVHPEDRTRIRVLIERLQEDASIEDVRSEFRFLCPNGTTPWIEMHAVRERSEDSGPIQIEDVDDSGELFGTLLDISARKSQETRIRQLAYYDVLTGLPNRRLMMERLQKILGEMRKGNGTGALLLLDLDDFKALNDTRGHDIGDELLIEVGKRLRMAVGPNATVARMGGDEFVVILTGLPPHEESARNDVRSLAKRILQSLALPHRLRRSGKSDSFVFTDAHSAACIGVTQFTAEKSVARDLIKQADLALYEAKAVGRNTIRFFTPRMQLLRDERSSLEEALRQALEENELELHYQAKVDSEGRPVSAEALLRWSHTERGAIPPSQFVNIAEESGLILPLGSYVLERACRTLATWYESPELRHLRLSINISPLEFREPAFVENVERTLRRHQFPPAHLQIELTESLFIDDVPAIIDRMNRLRDIGLRFALDDFGTGYSSLSYLKRLPLSQLKIDQTFVRDIARDANALTIVRTIIGMGRDLDLKVIAEGVESSAQRRLLGDAGCRFFQGNLFHRPCPRAEFEEWVRAYARL